LLEVFTALSLRGSEGGYETCRQLLCLAIEVMREDMNGGSMLLAPIVDICSMPSLWNAPAKVTEDPPVSIPFITKTTQTSCQPYVVAATMKLMRHLPQPTACEYNSSPTKDVGPLSIHTFLGQLRICGLFWDEAPQGILAPVRGHEKLIEALADRDDLLVETLLDALLLYLSHHSPAEEHREVIPSGDSAVMISALHPVKLLYAFLSQLNYDDEVNMQRIAAEHSMSWVNCDDIHALHKL